MTAQSVPSETTVRKTTASIWLFTLLSTAFIVAVSWILIPDVRHWFLLPLLVCGLLIMPDAWESLLGRRDFFDPQSLLGLFGTHFFFLAPILHFAFDFWPPYVDPAADWRSSFGLLACLNAGGLLAYRFVLKRDADPGRGPDSSNYDASVRTFVPFALAGALLGALAFATILARFGGLSGYVATVTNRDSREALGGSGWLLIIAESFPLLILVALLLSRRRTFANGNTLLLVLLFILFIIAQFTVGGMRGSRSNTVWPTLIAAAIIHLTVRRLNIKVIAAGGIAVFMFMFGYGLYKAAGTDVLGVVDGTRSLDAISSETVRDYEFLLLEDLGRTGIQGLVVDRYTRAPQTPAMGGTYVGAISILVPQSFLAKEDRPPSKVEVGSDVLYGSGAAEVGLYSSRIYGLGGEAMLNFGLMAIPFAYALFGLAVRRMARFYRQASASGSPLMKVVAGTTGVFTIMLLGSDLDNLIWFTMKQIAPIALIVFAAHSLTSSKTASRARRPPRVPLVQK